MSKGNGGVIFFELKKYVFLVVINIVFKRNKVNVGGVVYFNVDCCVILGNIRLSFINVNFIDCVVIMDGFVILIGKMYKL